jgi:hypothetical protein
VSADAVSAGNAIAVYCVKFGGAGRKKSGPSVQPARSVAVDEVNNNQPAFLSTRPAPRFVCSGSNNPKSS